MMLWEKYDPRPWDAPSKKPMWIVLAIIAAIFIGLAASKAPVWLNEQPWVQEIRR